MFILAVGFVFISCIKKSTTKSTSTASATTTTGSSTTGTVSTTGYAASTTSGSNPNAGNSTTTGSTSITNPCSENSSLTVGGSGWLYATCALSNSLTLKGINGSSEVTLTFSSFPTTGQYTISSIAGPTNVQLTVLNAPNQPTGIVWYAKNGVVNVNSTTSAISATFTSILCIQSNFNFPGVTITGNVDCN